MTNSKSLLQELIGRITVPYSDDELRAIVTQLLESVCGFSYVDSLAGKAVSELQYKTLTSAIERVNRSEPLQYILNEAHFFGRRFYIDPAVLIPRPETEELVALVRERIMPDERPARMIDIATGSGCIGITLQLELPGATVWGTDVSEAALAVARRNAEALGSRINLLRHDILGDKLPVADLDVIVSNPPYIMDSEKSSMDNNVLEYEPHLALFVSDSDPLVFYKSIAGRGSESLVSEGMIAVEINAKFGKEVAGIMVAAGYNDVEIIKDLAGKNRFVTARKGS